MIVERSTFSVRPCRKRKPRPLPPSEPEPSRVMGVDESAIETFSTVDASLLRCARTSERIQLRSQSGRSLPASSIKS